MQVKHSCSFYKVSTSIQFLPALDLMFKDVLANLIAYLRTHLNASKASASKL